MGYLGLIVIHADRDSPGNAMLDDRDENPIVKKEKEMTIRKFIDGDISPERRAKIITATTNHYTAFSDEGKEMIIAEHIEAAIANVTRPASPEHTDRESLLAALMAEHEIIGRWRHEDCKHTDADGRPALTPTEDELIGQADYVDALLRAAGGESGAKGGEG